MANEIRRRKLRPWNTGLPTGNPEGTNWRGYFEWLRLGMNELMTLPSPPFESEQPLPVIQPSGGSGDNVTADDVDVGPLVNLSSTTPPAPELNFLAQVQQAARSGGHDVSFAVPFREDLLYQGGLVGLSTIGGGDGIVPMNSDTVVAINSASAFQIVPMEEDVR